MNRLSTPQRAQILNCLIEGNSIRATCRLTGFCKDTVINLLCDIGPICSKYHDAIARQLPCKRLEVDEIWAFCGAKDRNVPDRRLGERGIGSVWTWVAIDSESKFIADWLVGNREIAQSMTRCSS